MCARRRRRLFYPRRTARPMAGEARGETVTATRTLKLTYQIKKLPEMPPELLRVLEGNPQLARVRESGDWRTIYSFVWENGQVAWGRLKRRPTTLAAPASIDWEARKLVVQLWQRPLELPIPRRALRWLREREREVAPLKVRKTVRIQWRPERAQALKVQVILRVQRPRPPQPDPKTLYWFTSTSTPTTASPQSSRASTRATRRSTRL